MKILKCPVCSGDADYYLNERSKNYFNCPVCKAVFMDPNDHLTAEQEKERYLEHNNDVNDAGYQEFVQPIVKSIEEKFSTENRGLDFGSGTGPVITKLLRDKGYNVTTFDPFFDSNSNALKHKYDFIACCEVAEHFRKPFDEFSLLKSLLNENGILLFMTELYNANMDFRQWYYKNDPTHICFYQEDTFKWLKNNFAFHSLEINRRLIKLTL